MLRVNYRFHIKRQVIHKIKKKLYLEIGFIFVYCQKLCFKVVLAFKQIGNVKYKLPGEK